MLLTGFLCVHYTVLFLVSLHKPATPYKLKYKDDLSYTPLQFSLIKWQN
jgi:hypothetical protein